MLEFIIGAAVGSIAVHLYHKRFLRKIHRDLKTLRDILKETNERLKP